MKKPNIILLLLMVLTCLTACHKDKEMNAKDPVVSNVEMTVSETQACFSWQVDFAGQFQTGVEVSQNENMADLRRVEASKEGDRYVAVVDGLSAGTKLYYRILVWNKFNNYEQEVKDFSTSPLIKITIACVPEEGGSVTGGGSYVTGETCILKVSANAGYTFLNWTENGQQISDEMEYSFAVNSERHIVANFIPVPTGAIKGLFTINANGDQVFFSQGNLQYHTEEAIWRFAEHQYDHIASSSTNTWMDLFCWGTGDNPTLFSGNENDYTTFVDWGVNAISNGGNQAGMWHTLSAEEWSYIINERENAITKYGIGNVDSIGGLILLPDNWHCPIGLTFNPGFSSENYDWSHNTYTVSEWQLMEDAGAVFLPAAGEKYVSVGPGGSAISIWGYNEMGVYWSFYGLHEGSRFLIFHSTYLDSLSTEGVPYYGYSVRLVCPAE